MPPKRTRRFQGLYYHSSPPKVIPMDGQSPEEKERKRRNVDDFSIKLSTIRIWMHEKDITNLTRVLWAGQGNRLRQQASTNPRVRRFLAAVPYVMNAIKDVHQAVVDNNLETLQAKLEPPVPTSLITCRDSNGLNIIHKAAGLGHTKILEYLISIWPDGAHETDITGKTPLHWAASAKNNMRCYTLLTEIGCNDDVIDYKMKTPSFYRHKSNEIERAFLTYVPDAPRVSPDVPTDWDALKDDFGEGKKMDIKMPIMNGPPKFSKFKPVDPEVVDNSSEDNFPNSKKLNKKINSNKIISENLEAFDIEKDDEKMPEKSEDTEPPTIDIDKYAIEESASEIRAKSLFENNEINDNDNSLDTDLDKDELELENHEVKTKNEQEDDSNLNNEDENNHAEILIQTTEMMKVKDHAVPNEENNVEISISDQKQNCKDNSPTTKQVEANDEPLEDASEEIETKDEKEMHDFVDIKKDKEINSIELEPQNIETPVHRKSEDIIKNEDLIIDKAIEDEKTGNVSNEKNNIGQKGETSECNDVAESDPNTEIKHNEKTKTFNNEHDNSAEDDSGDEEVQLGTL